MSKNEITVIVILNNKEYSYKPDSPELNNLLSYLEANTFLSPKYSLLIRTEKDGEQKVLRTGVKELELPFKIDINSALLEEPFVENPNFDRNISFNFSTKKFELLPTESFVLRLECHLESMANLTLIYFLKKGFLHNQIFIPSCYADKKVFRIDKYITYQNKEFKFEPMMAQSTITQYTPILSKSRIHHNKKKEIMRSNTVINKVLFCFFNDIIIDLINNSKKTILACIYNIENSQIVDALIDAKKRGVTITILSSYKCLESKHYSQQSSYYKLLQNNIPITAIIHSVDNQDIHSSMHTKFAVFDSYDILTGSVNWENLSCTTNEEQLLHISSESLAKQYELMHNMFCTGNTKEYDEFIETIQAPTDEENKVILHETLYTKSKCLKDMYNAINELNNCDCYISMFIFMKFCGDYTYNVFDLLSQKTKNDNVRLHLIVEENTNSASFGLYYQHKIPSNKYLDEVENWKNTTVYRLKTYKGNNPYSAIHHKFFATENFVICGSANWWDISFTSEDDILIIRDKEVNKQFIQAWHDLIYPFFTLNNLPNLSKLPNLPNVYLEVIAPIPLEAIKMNYSVLMKEFYVQVPIIPTSSIQYRYYYDYDSKSGITYEDLIRTKTFEFYKETDHWGKVSHFDGLIKNIKII